MSAVENSQHHLSFLSVFVRPSCTRPHAALTRPGYDVLCPPFASSTERQRLDSFSWAVLWRGGAWPIWTFLRGPRRSSSITGKATLRSRRTLLPRRISPPRHRGLGWVSGRLSDCQAEWVRGAGSHMTKYLEPGGLHVLVCLATSCWSSEVGSPEASRVALINSVR